MATNGCKMLGLLRFLQNFWTEEFSLELFLCLCDELRQVLWVLAFRMDRNGDVSRIGDIGLEPVSST